jgi:PAS domain S-box-containing protein
MAEVAMKKLKNKSKRAKIKMPVKSLRFGGVKLRKTGEGVLFLDDKGVIRDANAAAERMLDRRCEQLAGRMLESILIDGQRTEINIRRGDGSWGIGEVHYFELEAQAQRCTLVSISDVTENERLVETLNIHQENFKRVTQGISDFTYELKVTPDGGLKLDVITDAAAQYFGDSIVSGVNYEAVLRAIHQDDRQSIQKRLENLMKNRFDVSEYRVVGKKGEIRWLRDHGIPFWDAKLGRVTRILGVVQDISERKFSDEALREREELYKNLFELESDAVFLIDDETGCILEANKLAEAMYGYSHKEFMKLRNIDLAAKQSVLQNVAASATGSDTVGYHRRKDSTVFPVEITSNYFEFRKRRVHIAAIRDITRRLQAETALRESEERFSKAFQASTIAISISRLDDDRYVDVNGRFLELIECEREEVVGHAPAEINLWPDARGHAQVVGELPEKKFLHGIQLDLRSKSGKIKTCRSSLELIDIGGETCILSILEDITERKKAEEALVLLSHTVKSIGECISITDLNNIVLFVNEAFLTTYGLTESEIIGKSIDVVKADQTVDEKAVIKETLKGGWQGEIMNRKKDGTIFPISLSTSAVLDDKGKPIALVGVATDITERKWAQRALEVSEKKYRDIVMWAPVGIYQSTRSGKMLSANRSIAELLGYSSVDELIGCNMGEAVYYDEMDRERLIARHDASGENVPVSFETRWKKKDGSTIWVLMTVHDVRDKSKQILYYEGFVFDNTERRRAEEALRESEERYRLLVENSTDLVTEISNDGKFLYLSPNVKPILDFEPTDLAGSKVLSKVYTKDKEVIGDILSRMGGSATYRYRDRSGGWHWFESSGRVYQTSAGERRMVMVSRDITQRRKAEQELEVSRRQLQHFTEHLEHTLEEEKKRISRELHDELGQLLTILKFDLSWLRLEGAKGDANVIAKIDAMMTSLNDALASVKRISREIRPPQLDALGLSGALQWDIEQVEKKIGLKGYVTLEPEEFEVKGQISTVLYRVFREALTNIVRHAQARTVFVRLSQRPDSVVLSVRDDGRGISKQELKGEKSLGLVGIRERIRMVGGSLSIEGKVGKGTMLTAEVPLAKKEKRRSQP